MQTIAAAQLDYRLATEDYTRARDRFRSSAEAMASDPTIQHVYANHTAATVELAGAGARWVRADRTLQSARAAAR